MNEEENIDKTLAILRTQEAEQAVVMEQYRVAAGDGRPAAGMLLNEAVIESTSVDGIADQAVDSIRRFESALMGAGLPPLAIEEDFRLGNGVFFTALGVVSLAARAALQLQVQQVLVRVRLARETALKPLAGLRCNSWKPTATLRCWQPSALLSLSQLRSRRRTLDRWPSTDKAP